MINNSFTDQQAKTIFTLLLSNKTEPQIVRATGLSLRLVQYIIQSKRQTLSNRVLQHRNHILQSERVVDAMREVLGMQPLYDVQEELKERSKERSYHYYHTKGKIERTKQQQANKIKAAAHKIEEPSILDQLLVMSK